MAKAPYSVEYVGTCLTYQASSDLASEKPTDTKAPPNSAWRQRTCVLGT